MNTRTPLTGNRPLNKRRATPLISLLAKRALAKKKRLYEIQQMIDNQYVQQAMDAALAAPLKLGNRDGLVAAANAISQAAHDFAETADGAELGGALNRGDWLDLSPTRKSYAIGADPSWPRWSHYRTK